MVRQVEVLVGNRRKPNIPVDTSKESEVSGDGSNIRIVADLSSVADPSAGQYPISNSNLEIYVDSVGNDVGAVGTDYRVVVSLTPDQ